MSAEDTGLDVQAHRELLVSTRETDVFIVATSPEARRRVLSDREVRDGLIEAGNREAVAAALLRDAKADASAWADVAQVMGMEVAEVARLAGVARGTVYNRRH